MSRLLYKEISGSLNKSFPQISYRSQKSKQSGPDVCIWECPPFIDRMQLKKKIKIYWNKCDNKQKIIYWLVVFVLPRATLDKLNTDINT